MIHSLRGRVFLISWPIVVVAVLLVALGVERWALEQVVLQERHERAEAPERAQVAWPDSIAPVFERLATAEGRALLQRLVQRVDSSVVLVVLAPDGSLAATTDSSFVPDPSVRMPDGAAFVRRIDGPRGSVAEQQIVVDGRPIRGARGDTLGTLFVLPVAEDPPFAADGAWRVGLRRTLWWTALVASLAAAAAALLLAVPLVRRLHQLTAAAREVQHGALETRVAVRGAGELAELERSFNEMAAALGASAQQQRNLVSDVAHELRTPLTNILGSIEAMQDGLRAADAASLASLREETALLATLVNELQELSLAESGRLAFYMEDVDAVAASVAAVEAMRDAAGPVALVAPADRTPVAIHADPTRVAQVLRNLLRNAIAHTPAGGRVEVHVRRDSTAGTVEIAVSDTGRGIPAAQLGLIWERFHRVDPSRDRASGGMGLGLTLVRQLVEGMGGSVRAESEEGRGSVFRVTLQATESLTQTLGS